MVAPQTRTVGGTFETSFTLPEPANAGGVPKKDRKTSKPTKKRLTQVKPKKATKSPCTYQDRREYRRAAQAKRRVERKALGLCIHCSNHSIPGQTRCPSCSEKHRLSRRSGISQDKDCARRKECQIKGDCSCKSLAEAKQNSYGLAAPFTH